LRNERGSFRFDYASVPSNTFWGRANPGVSIPEYIREITGVTDEKVAEYRPPKEGVRDFFVWAGPGALHAAHSGEFERGSVNGGNIALQRGRAFLQTDDPFAEFEATGRVVCECRDQFQIPPRRRPRRV